MLNDHARFSCHSDDELVEATYCVLSAPPVTVPIDYTAKPQRATRVDLRELMMERAKLQTVPVVARDDEPVHGNEVVVVVEEKQRSTASLAGVGIPVEGIHKVDQEAIERRPKKHLRLRSIFRPSTPRPSSSNAPPPPLPTTSALKTPSSSKLTKPFSSFQKEELRPPRAPSKGKGKGVALNISSPLVVTESTRPDLVPLETKNLEDETLFHLARQRIMDVGTKIIPLPDDDDPPPPPRSSSRLGLVRKRSLPNLLSGSLSSSDSLNASTSSNSPSTSSHSQFGTTKSQSHARRKSNPIGWFTSYPSPSPSTSVPSPSPSTSHGGLQSKSTVSLDSYAKSSPPSTISLSQSNFKSSSSPLEHSTNSRSTTDSTTPRSSTPSSHNNNNNNNNERRRKPSIPEAALKAIMSLGRRNSTSKGSSHHHVGVSDEELNSWRRPPVPPVPTDADMEVLDGEAGLARGGGNGSGSGGGPDEDQYASVLVPVSAASSGSGLATTRRSEDADEDVLIIESPPLMSPVRPSTSRPSMEMDDGADGLTLTTPRGPQRTLSPSHETPRSKPPVAPTFRFPAVGPQSSAGNNSRPVSSTSTGPDEDICAFAAAADRFLMDSATPPKPPITPTPTPTTTATPNHHPPTLLFRSSTTTKLGLTPPPARNMNARPRITRGGSTPLVSHSHSHSQSTLLSSTDTPSSSSSSSQSGISESGTRRFISSEAWSRVSLSASSPKRPTVLVRPAPPSSSSPDVFGVGGRGRGRRGEVDGGNELKRRSRCPDEEEEEGEERELGHDVFLVSRVRIPLTPPPSPPKDGQHGAPGPMEMEI
ncbi:hypothetical protein T439DRAFT_380202 [Meredithblackwellia eburnea MCA 4105]